tara:strand:- start:184 stop:828 length:645 start_codon:yes stop_codon:yes gene_type:complete
MNALLIGCGSKWGLGVLQYLLDTGWRVYSMSSSNSVEHENLHQLDIDWNTLDQTQIQKYLSSLPNLDFVFFNQNGSALSYGNFDQQLALIDTWKLEKNWAQQYFVSVILPYHIIKTVRLHKQTVVAWMLSTYIYKHSNIDHADYIGNKYQNYLMMKNFSRTHDACYCGINPMELQTNATKTQQFVETVLGMDKQQLNGNVIYLNGKVDNNFEMF